MKAIYKWILVVCILLPAILQAQTRPSVSGNATRITLLESNQQTIRQDVDVNSGDIDNLQQQIDENRLAIEAIEPVAGPAGPPGAPGPLSGLQCEVGQVVVWDGSTWVCATLTNSSASLSKDECIRGFPFAFGLFDAQSPNNWNVLCEEFEGTETRFSLTGNLLIDTRLLDGERTLLGSETTFSNNLTDIYIAPFLAERDVSTSTALPFIDVTLTAFTSGEGSGVKDWALQALASPSGREEQLNIEFNSNEFRLNLRDCYPTSFSDRPVATGGGRSGDFYVKEILSLRCNRTVSLDLAQHPLLNAILTDLLTEVRNDNFINDISIFFDTTLSRGLDEFNRQYPSAEFVRYEFPRFTRTFNDGSGGSVAGIGPWTVNSQSIAFKSIQQPL